MKIALTFNKLQNHLNEQLIYINFVALRKNKA